MAELVEVLEMGGRRSGRKPFDIEYARFRYEVEFASLRALVAETGWSYGTVHRKLTEAGVVLRGPGGDTTRRRGPDTQEGERPSAVA